MKTFNPLKTNFTYFTYQSFPYTTPGALFRKLMLLDRDFLNSALRLYTENFGINFQLQYDLFF